MNLAARLKFETRRLVAGARRSFVGALGWVLIAVGAAAIVTPVPFAIPVLFAGAALLEETNPKVSGAILGLAAAARHKVTQLGTLARTALRGVSPPRHLVARVVPGTSR